MCLVLKGSSLNVQNKAGQTPLDALIESHPPVVVQTLLRIRTRMLQSIIQAPVWVADATVSSCQMCRKQFGRLQFTRKHHCRMCGRIVCSTCSEHKRPLPKLMCEEAVRLCNMCVDALDGESGKYESRLESCTGGLTSGP